MNQSDPIVIVCVCGNHYSILLAALMKSIEVNHHSGERLDFYIVEDNISNKNKNKLTRSIGSKNITITWLKMSECIPSEFNLPTDNSTYPVKIYIKLFIPYFLPAGTKRALFLDVDMIMLEDISKLWNTDLKDNIVAAVQDQFVQIVSRWGGISNYEAFNLSPDTTYFNTGLVLFDLDKWKKENVTQKVIDCTKENQKHVSFGDQYGMNIVLANKWLELDLLWNRFAYSTEKRPFLIHFSGRKPIYKTYEYSEDYKAIFYEYLRKTEWKNFKPVGETRRYFSKLNNIYDKLLKKLGK